MRLSKKSLYKFKFISYITLKIFINYIQLYKYLNIIKYFEIFFSIIIYPFL